MKNEICGSLFWPWSGLAVCLALGLGSCADVATNGSGDLDSDADSDTDTDSDTDSDTDTDTDSDTDTDTDADAGPTTCDDEGDCGGEPCVDGYCCDSPCDGTCQACDLAGHEGTCRPYAAGEDPDDECAQEDPSTCGMTGVCDGASACERYGAETACDDGEPCTSEDACDGAGACEGLVPTDCDPGPANQCCEGACSSISGCYTDTGTCADTCATDALTVGRSCVGCGGANAEGICSGGSVVACTEASHTLCAAQECGGDTYYCTNIGGTWAWRTAVACDDEDDCSYNDVCYEGDCIATSYSCDSETCMQRECEGDGGCAETPAGDDVECGTTTCPPDECSSGTWQNYDPTCTSMCDGEGGCEDCECVPDPVSCTVHADNLCCVSMCSPSSGCYTVAGACPGGDVCTDPNFLNVGSVCEGCGGNGAQGTCGPSGVFECSAANNTICQSVGCGGSTYYCTYLEGAWRWRPSNECDDGEQCTYDDTCGGPGTCAGSPITCADSADGCVQRECDGTDTCAATYPSGTGCVDTDPCTYGTTCDGGGACSGGTTVDCDALDTQCANHSCDGDDTCAVVFSTAPCDDGNSCTYGEFCNGAGSCTSGTTLDCDALDTECVDYSCDGDDTCASTVLEGEPCDDGDPLTSGDTCQEDGSCAGETTCPLPIEYTWDTTSEGWGGGDNWFWDDTAGVIFFYYDPQIEDYQTLANSPELDLSGCASVTLSYDVELADYQNGAGDTLNSEILWVLCTGDGTNWYVLNAYADGDDATDASFVATGETAALPAECRTATAYIGLVAEGLDSYNIDWWSVDNVEITQP